MALYIGLTVNGTPDAEYPLRILRACRSHCDPEMRVTKRQKELERQRAKVLDDAIATLEAVG